MTMTKPLFRIRAGQKFAVTVVAAATAVLLAAWGFGNAAAGIAGGGAARAAVREKIAHRAEERRRAKLSEAVMAHRADDVARIAAFPISRASPVAFLEAVEGMAARTGATVAIDVDEGRTTETSLRFRFTVEGIEQNVLRFVQALELLPYRLDILEMGLQNTSPETPDGGRRAPRARLVLALDVVAR